MIAVHQQGQGSGCTWWLVRGEAAQSGMSGLLFATFVSLFSSIGDAQYHLASHSSLEKVNSIAQPAPGSQK